MEISKKLNSQSSLLSNKGKYRPEIDGLRALAVIAVIVNHFNKDFLPSGYLGVDIFFVISGYVITASLSSKKRKKSFINFIYDFYSRRLRRLVPALFVFVFFAGLLITFFNPSPDRFLLAGVASLLGVSNIYFFHQTTDYFAQSTLLNPFTHTWSLGIEEQFYFLYPILFWFSGYGINKQKNENKLVFLLIFFSIVSLILFIYFYKFNQPSAYFLIPNRFWEIAFGCISFFCYKNNSFKNVLQIIPSHLVIILILGIFFAPSSFAVINTISIVLLTVLLLLTFKNNIFIYRLFTKPKVVYIGLISYSLYLWHWGVLVISRWTIGIDKWTLVFQFILIFLLASASYHFIEVPIRRGRASNLISTLSSIFVISIGLISLILFRINAKYLYLGKTVNYGELAKLDNGSKKFLVEKPRRNYLVLGDSFVGHYKYLFESLSNDYSVNVYLHERRQGFQNPKILSESFEYLKPSVNDYHSLLKKNDVVITSIGDFESILSKKSFKEFQDLINLIKGKNLKLLIVGSPPFFKEGIYALCSREWFRPEISENCSPRLRENIKTVIKPIGTFYKKLSMDKDVYYFDPFDILCSKEMLYCRPVQDGNYLFTDASHLSKFGSMKIYPEIIKFMIKTNLLLDNKI